jgi:Protein of unknown function (DUF3754)
MHADECAHFIPLARGELTELLCSEPTLTPADVAGVRRLADLLGAYYHFEFDSRFRNLKEAYFTFDPDTDNTALLRLTPDERQARLNRLYKDLGALLERARFRHLGRDEIEPALDGASEWGLRMDVDFSAFEHVAIFARGDAYQKRTRRRLRTLYRSEEVDVPVYRRLVLMLKLRDHPRLPEPVDTHNVYLKVFKDIPRLDVMMLLPGARVRFNLLDRGRVGLPILGGLAMAVWNFFRELSQFFETLLLAPSVVWGLAAGSIGYGYKSFYGYLHLRQRYHLTLTRSLYFQNLDSNAGVLTRLVDEAEAQECLTVLLGYWCLWRYAEPDGSTVDNLDTAMDLYLDRCADVSVRCESGAALRRLRSLGLVEEENGHARAVPLADAIAAVQAACERHFAADACDSHKSSAEVSRVDASASRGEMRG